MSARAKAFSAPSSSSLPTAFIHGTIEKPIVCSSTYSSQFMATIKEYNPMLRDFLSEFMSLSPSFKSHLLPSTRETESPTVAIAPATIACFLNCSETGACKASIAAMPPAHQSLKLLFPSKCASNMRSALGSITFPSLSITG